jgi:hypothetical protein
MHARRAKTWLRIAAGGLLASAGAALAWGVFCPIAEQEPSEQRPMARSGSHDGKDHRTAMPTLAQFEPLCRRPLRRPLYDPPPKTKSAPVVVAKTPPPLNVRLVGTALEPDHSMAMLLTSCGTIEMKSVGDKLDDTPDSAELTSIEQDRVTLRYHGQTVRLEVESKDGR